MTGRDIFIAALTENCEFLGPDCGACGMMLEPTRPDGLLDDESDHVCKNPFCKAINRLAVGESCDDCNGEVYVSSWTCQHGISGEDVCWICHAEERRDEVAWELDRVKTQLAHANRCLVACGDVIADLITEVP